MVLSFVKKLKTDEWEKMVDVNIKGIKRCSRCFLPLKINKDTLSIFHRQQLINISGGAVYCATKAAVKMFSEGLRQELAPKYGICVTSIEPELYTNLMDTITDEDILGKLSEMQKMTMLEPEDIAEAFYALTQPSRVNINDVYIMPTEQQ
jgi:NADP-dependent 3-hydroxy acid dehydrogenase YdfG